MSRRLAALGAAAALALSALAGPTLAGSAAAAPVAPAVGDVAPTAVAPASVLSGPAAELLRLLNAERTSRGLSPLTADASITRVAQAWSQHQADVQRMYHNPDVGRQIPSGWSRWGENVAWNQPADAARMHAAWMNSPGHRANILDARFTHIGIGFVTDRAGRGWGTQVFATYPAGALPRFSDVPTHHPFFREVEWMAARGITTGYADGTFRPREAVTREAMAAFLYRSLTGSTGSPACTGTTRVFTDVRASHPFCGAIEWAARNGYAQGYPDGTYRPKDLVSRQAMAAFLHRAAGSPAGTCTGSRFGDVGPANRFCVAIEWMARTGVSTGYTDGTFRPTASVTRDATAAFLYRTRR